jgi:hypothetical protein
VRGIAIGPKQELIGPDFAVAVENGLAGDKHFHVIVIERNRTAL